MPPKRQKIEEPEKDPEENVNQKAPKRGRKSIAKLEPISDEQKIEESQYIEDLFDVICSYKDEEGRDLAIAFYLLPPKTSYPDYYELINNPIDLKTIANNILDKKYQNLKEFDADLTLLFDNAKRYNDPKSLIYKDAAKLRKLTKETSKNLSDLQLKNKLFESNREKSDKLEMLNQISKFVESDLLDEQEISDEETEIQQKKPKNKLYTTMWDLFDILKDQNDSESFLKLPSKKQFPDYYEDIKNPIALNTIKKKLNKRVYENMTDFQNDLELMFKNAMEYNLETSVVYKRAKNLLDMISSKFKVVDLSSPKKSSNDLDLKFYDPKQIMTHLYNYINNYKIDERELALPFRHLPSRTEYPDYYNIIKKPIDMTKISNRINSYQNLDDFCTDFALMFENACIYNEPSSMLYKDALNLQRELFTKRNEISQEDSIAKNYIIDQVKELIKQLFEAVIEYQDLDGRVLSESFLEFYGINENLKTFNQIKNRLSSYTRLDEFQYHLFQIFEQARSLSNKNSQLFKDSFDLQRFYIQKRDELCKNGEFLQSPALNFKLTTLDSQAKNYSFDEAEILRSNEVCLKLSEEKMDQKHSEKLKSSGFYIIDGKIYCVLGQNETKCLLQLYSKPNEFDYFKRIKIFSNQVFKTDIYLIKEIDSIQNLEPCLVISLKDYLLLEADFNNKPQENEFISISKENIFICESIYNSKDNYYRKLSNKKWSPLNFIGKNEPINLAYNFNFIKRQVPPHIERVYLDKDFIEKLIFDYDQKNNFNFVDKPIDSVQFDSNFKIDKDEDSPDTEETHIPKSAKYFEQIKINDLVYKLGDFVYVKYRQLHSNQIECDKPLILRINGIWSDDSSKVSFRGPVFLRPENIPHDPTRLFFKNEVFKEISTDLTIPFDQVIGSRCLVLNTKCYSTQRVTLINEDDIFICETKYNLVTKTFRKFTKGMKKFDLSVKCREDEILFMRNEILPRRYLSPLLVNLKIDYENGTIDYLKNFNLDEEEWNEEMKDDENSNHSLPENDLIKTVKPETPEGKIKIKKLKKTGFNLFSREFRKSLRDTKSSLGFTEMSKEVGLRWRALSDKERQSYEERAAIETKEILNAIQTPIPVQSPRPVQIIHQQVQSQSAPSSVELPTYTENPRHVQHRDAYIKYIANLKRTQLLHQSGMINNPMANVALARNSDWYNGIDILGSKVKESKLQSVPSSWIENSNSNDVLQNLISLRYYMLQDAVTIENDVLDDICEIEQIETIGLNDKQVTLTVL
ncbi:unnamed protein product [Brachionus calyciflorus]|uniref:Uncharacterized protein n=1 Tax=Brachionus calyciflorus TaxID=104777 RepID=A0A813LY33_9BILA|nr:unnamed protein product [Brachionus calyciflorus]